MEERLKPYILLIPIMIILIFVFALGLVMGFLQSLGIFKAVGLGKFTLKYYKEILGSKSFTSSLGFSLYISLISSLISTVLGVLLAYSIFRSEFRSGIGRIFNLPITVPHIVTSLLMYNILAQSGILPRLLYNLNIIGDQTDFPSLLYSKNGLGIILTYMWKEIPFVAMVTYSILNNVNDRLGEAAKNLGANNRQVFFHILLPLIGPSVFSSFIIIFAYSFGAYEVPLLLGPTSPQALPIKAFVEYSNPDLTNRPYAMVINMILIFVSLILVWLYKKSFDLISKYKN